MRATLLFAVAAACLCLNASSIPFDPAAVQDHLYTFDTIDIDSIERDPSIAHSPHISRVASVDASRPALHAQQLHLQVSAFDEVHVLDLELNRNLLPERFVSVWTTNSSLLEASSEVEHCFYVGSVRGRPGSVAALSTCHGAEGIFETQGERYYILPSSRFAQHMLRADAKLTVSDMRSHVVYRHSDLVTPPKLVCGVDEHHQVERTFANENPFHTMGMDGLDHDHDHQGHVHAPAPLTLTSEQRALAAARDAAAEQSVIDRWSPEKRAAKEKARARYDEEEMARRSNFNPGPMQPLNESAFGVEACATSTAANYVAPDGCACLSTFNYNSKTFCNGECTTEGSSTPWCYTTAACAANSGLTWAYCTAIPTSKTCYSQTASQVNSRPTNSSCNCRPTWKYSGQWVCNSQCGSPDGDATPWCYTKETCGTASWAYCSVPAPAPAPTTCSSNSIPSSYQPPSGCSCASTWSYNGQTICNSKCGSPDNDTPWCYTSATCAGKSWAYCSVPSTNTPAPTVNTGSTRNLEILMVSDLSQVTRAYTWYSGSVQTPRAAAQLAALNIANVVQTVYTKLNQNVFISVVAVFSFSTDVGGASLETSSGLATSCSDSMDNYLNKFTTWRNKYNGKYDLSLTACSTTSGSCVDLKNDNAVLLTACQRSAPTIGLAWVGTMCSSSATSVVMTNGGNSNFIAFSADTMAHEIGHNFGASHDGSGNSCDPSNFVMAAYAPSNSDLSWSSCSANTILGTLQGSSVSCLTNQPRLGPGGAVCGNLIVEGSEQCDLGSKNGASGSPCDAACKTVSGFVCSSGPCCDTATGSYRAANTLCRAAASDCDIADYCTGKSASCPSDSYRPDGTVCSSAGFNAKCYKGACMGIDGQCASTWSSYSGVWVGYRDSIKARCINSGCGELQCTNTEWTDYCYVYNCPSGYTCTIASYSLRGPANQPVCSCMAYTDSVTKIYVKDGTPCTVSSWGEGDKICVSGSCIARPASTGAQTGVCDPLLTCGMRGECDSNGNCVCNPGFRGDTCAEKVPCPYQCGSINRESCRFDNYCGRCLPGYNTLSAILDATTPCDLTSSSTVSVSSSPSLGGTSPYTLFNDSSAVWISTFYPPALATRSNSTLPYVVVGLSKPEVLTAYTLGSSYLAPALDPRSWLVEGSPDGVRWTVLDNQTNIEFPARGFLLSPFAVKPVGAFSFMRITITDVYDWTTQGGASITPSTSTTSGGSSQNSSTTFSNSTDYIPRVAFSQLQFYTETATVLEYAPSEGSSNVPMIAGIAGGVGGCLLVVAAALFLLKKNRAGKATSSSADSVSSNAIQMSTTTPYQPVVQTSSVSSIPVPAPRQAVQPAIAPAPTTTKGSWVEYKTDDGHLYYYNPVTQESRWEKPSDF